MSEDEKDFEEWLFRKYPEAKYWSFRTLKIKDMELAWCEGRRTLREKMEPKSGSWIERCMVPE